MNEWTNELVNGVDWRALQAAKKEREKKYERKQEKNEQKVVENGAKCGRWGRGVRFSSFTRMSVFPR